MCEMKQAQKKESILLSFNKVARLDRVMYDVLDSMLDLSDLRYADVDRRLLICRSFLVYSRSLS